MKIQRKSQFSILASGLCLTAVLVGTANIPSLSAAPVLDAQDKKVVDRLSYLLNKRVKKPNGDPVNVVIVPTARASEGYFSQIRISGAPVQLKKKMQLSKLDLDAKNVKIDVASLWSDRKVRTEHAETTLRAVITEDDLTETLSHGRHTKDMNLQVKFLGDRLQVTGNINYLLVNGPVIGVGKLRYSNDHKVYLDILSMKLRGVEVPAFIKNQFSSHINPLIDYSDLPFNPPFKNLKIVGSKAFLTT